MTSVDVDQLLLKGQTLSTDVRSAITEATLTRTIDSCPTLSLTVQDAKRAILKSGVLKERVTIQFYDYAFELAQVKKSGNKLTVVLEDLAVAELRRHNDVTPPQMGVTRVQFVKNILATETPWIQLYVDPAVQEPVATVALSRGSIASTASDTANANYFGTGSVATPAPTTATAKALSAAQIAGAASAAGFTGENLVIAVAVALAESGGVASATHKNTNGSTDYGLWQINSIHADLLRKGTWSDPLGNAKMAYSISGGSNWKPWVTFKNGAYKKYLANARAAAGNANTDYAGYTTGTTSDGTVLEDSWTCFKRVFNEVGWRLYADKGNLYAGPDSHFIDKDPVITVREYQDGVDDIDFDFDAGKPVATLTIKARADLWLCPPGSVIRVPDLGLANEKWLCSSITRSLFSRDVSIVATSPQPELPEPAGDSSSPTDYFGDPTSVGGVPGSGEASNGVFTWPTANRTINSPFGGARGHKGIDIGVPQGTPVYASRGGTITHASNTDPGGYGNAVYISHPDQLAAGVSGPVGSNIETRYGHLSSFGCRVGMVVKQGQQIGLSGGKKGSPGAGDATGPHLHFEIRLKGTAVDPLKYLSNSPTSAFTAAGAIVGLTGKPLQDTAAVKGSTGLSIFGTGSTKW